MSQVAQVLCDFYSDEAGIWGDAVNSDIFYYY